MQMLKLTCFNNFVVFVTDAFQIRNRVCRTLQFIRISVSLWRSHKHKVISQTSFRYRSLTMAAWLSDFSPTFFHSASSVFALRLSPAFWKLLSLTSVDSGGFLIFTTLSLSDPRLALRSRYLVLRFDYLHTVQYTSWTVGAILSLSVLGCCPMK